MSSFPQIVAALETRLAALVPALPTGFEGVVFNPPMDPYQVVNFLPAEPQNPTLGSAMYRELGIMQITLSYPMDGTGAGAARTQAEALRAWFARGTSVSSGGITAVIERTPNIGPARVNGGRYVLPVSIRYFANVM